MMIDNSHSYMRGVKEFYPKLKFFWSCSHMNCCLHYILHINLFTIYLYFINMNLNLKAFQESNEYIKSYQASEIEFLMNFNSN